jgi:metal-responsive CopG/Arc/MetJ family transcriptional regulator
MATINVSVPEKLKERFYKAFPHENRSAVIARLIERAIEERERRRRGEAAVLRILARRSRTRPVTAAEIRRILEDARRA